MPDPKHVLVAESDPQALEQLALALRSAGYATWEADTGRDALRSVQIDRPDLVIVGLSLSDIGGRDLARILCSSGDSQSVPTLVVAGPGSHDDMSLAMGGAPEVPVTMWSHIDEVVTKVNEMFDLSAESAPECYSAPVVVQDVTIHPASMTVDIGGKPVDLTDKEFRFLQVLALNEARTCTRDELRKLVWGQEADVIGRTIDVLVSRLRSKLTAATGRDLIATVRGIGYRFTA